MLDKIIFSNSNLVVEKLLFETPSIERHTLPPSSLTRFLGNFHQKTHSLFPIMIGHNLVRQNFRRVKFSSLNQIFVRLNFVHYASCFSHTTR